TGCRRACRAAPRPRSSPRARPLRAAERRASGALRWRVPWAGGRFLEQDEGTRKERLKTCLILAGSWAPSPGPNRCRDASLRHRRRIGCRTMPGTWRWAVAEHGGQLGSGEGRWLWLAIGIALLLRVSWLLLANPVPVSDYEVFRRLAQDL